MNTPSILMKSVPQISDEIKTNLRSRLRRNRHSQAIREIVQETRLHPSDLGCPLFLLEGKEKRIPIPSLPGIERLSIDLAIQEIATLLKLGIQTVLLFPVIEPSLKTAGGCEAINPKGLLPKAIRAIKERFPNLLVMADVALDPYTTHGHDGLLGRNGEILNDETVAVLVEMSLMLAEAGIDFVAPSDMMDGRILAIREKLDRNGFLHVGILAYSAKYASSLYGPFREALHVQLQFGDKKSYQLNPANIREALLEADLDEKEGADLLMVKPALHYLDVLSLLRMKTQKPLAAYHVSGEYAMVMAAHEKGWLSAPNVFYEALLSIKRAGADLIFTYAIKHLSFLKN